MKVALLLLLLMSGLSTPSFAQPCTRDVIASVSNSDDGQIITMVSGAVFRVLPPKDSPILWENFLPWLWSGEHMLICGDHSLISMEDNCRVGLNCTAGVLDYHLFAVECLRCLR